MALFFSSFQHHPDASIIIVDNASTDITAFDTLRLLNATAVWAGQLQIIRQVESFSPLLTPPHSSSLLPPPTPTP
jgi:hypothetical protein